MSNDQPDTASAATDAPTAATATDSPTAAPAGSGTSGADGVEMGAIVIGLIATVVLLACAVLIQVDKKWDEARRCLQAGHKAMLEEFRTHRATWQTDHDANIESAKDELKRLQDRKATAAEITAAQERLDKLELEAYKPPKSANDVSFNIDGSPVLVSLKVDVGDLTWFRKGEFIFHEYTPADGDNDFRADEFGRYWYIEVFVPAPEPADDNAAENAPASDNMPASSTPMPPAGRARIYADGTMAGPFDPSQPVPDGHPVLESSSTPAR